MLLNCVIRFLYMHVLKIIFGNIFLPFFLCFSAFCVKRPDGGSVCPDGEADLSGRAL
jgi:hypothetical protein